LFIFKQRQFDLTERGVSRKFMSALKKFFSPKSVAVIGASTSPDKLGYAVVRNLVDSGFAKQADVYPINPKADDIIGLKAYPSVMAIPGAVDLAVVVIPYPQVPAAIRECGQKGVSAAIIISAGFREAGMEGVEREQELLAVARSYGIRLIGPNCLGVIDTVSLLNASFAAGSPPTGPMAFMSQSGALGTAILDWAQAGQLGLSKFVSLGNKADVNEIDLLEEWGTDPNTNVILIYCEELPKGPQFIETARRISKIKPIVAIKSGTTDAGSRAVSSHTGSLAGSEQAYQAAFRQAGVLRAESMEDLFDMARAFAYQPLLKGERIAIITNAGGPGILATDALERSGLSLARLKSETKLKLQQFLPSAASAANPVDVLGDARADRYRFALETVAADPNVDGILVLLTPQAMTEIEAVAHDTVVVAKQVGKPVFGCFMGASKVLAGIEILTKGGVPNYSFPERAALMFAAMARYRQILLRPQPEFASYDVDKARVAKLIERVIAEGRNTIGDLESREVLEAYALPMPRSALARTPDEAVQLAGQYGYPVVLKIASPDILHKTDVGGVKVGLRSASDVRDAYELMVMRAQRFIPDARIWGCLVQEMAPAGGLEVLVGMNRDPQFGPLVTFGLGGIYVETLKDVTFRLAPFSKIEAAEMLGEIRAHALLDGVRGKAGVDKAAILDTLGRIGQLVQDFPQIVELDINPLLVYEHGAIAIDMRLVLQSKRAYSTTRHH
jgi:acetyltransferase